MLQRFFGCVLLLLAASQVQADRIAKRLEQEVTYFDQSTECKGYTAYLPGNKRLPVVLILPEWWGCGEYVKMRAKQLADEGYYAFAIDMYGEGKQAETPEEAGKLASPFYQNGAMANQRIQAAIDFVKKQTMADPSNINAIGFCFGGGLALNAARTGIKFKHVISFHGNLMPQKFKSGSVSSKILVCNGEADEFVSKASITAFKKEMKNGKVKFTFINYKNATHAFTNPHATETGKKFNLPIAYNQEAAMKAWQDMLLFLKK
ncbi:MAG: dienelactone hydrolase family protein [Chitinophagaceae bacterium]|nr:dienelactone hydrolase family protein [Chitinophagaceae bacterium]